MSALSRDVGVSALDSMWRPLGTYKFSISVLVLISSPICCIQGMLDIRVAFAAHLTTDDLSNENKVIFNGDITFN